MFPKRRRTIAAIFGVVVALSAVPARAALITVDWDVVPHDDRELVFDDSPYYDCSGSRYPDRLCRSLWDTGLTLEATRFSFYDDKWFDGYGIGEWESSIFGGVQRIRPECKAGLSPCFDSFTPQTLRIAGLSYDRSPSPNLFVLSSRGGLVKLPSLSGLASVDFVGGAWQDLTWIEVGFYLPEICETDPGNVVCMPHTEKALIVEDLTFAAVPEPGLLSLLAAGALGIGVRRRYRA